MPIETLKLLNIHPDARNKKGKEKLTGTEASSIKEGSSSGRPPNSRSVTETTDDSARSGANTPTAADGAADLARIQADHAAASSAAPSTMPYSGSTSGSTSSFNVATKPGMAENVESAMDTGKGLARIVSAGFKSPMDFSLNVAKGFHNVPKLYGADVRQVDKVTDFQSGMKTAAKVIQVVLSRSELTNIKISNLVSGFTMALPAL